MRIGEAARKAGCRPSAIRFYERAGLLPPAPRVAGRRQFTPGILPRLGLIQLAKQAGFTLREIRQVIGELPAGSPVSVRWQKLARNKLADLDRQERQLRLMRQILKRLVACRCLDLGECERAIARQASVWRGRAAGD